MSKRLALTTVGLATGVLVALGVAGSFGIPAAGAAAAGTGSTYFPLTAVRLFDTRTNNTALGAGAVKTVTVAGVAGVPAGATALILNVTVVDGTAGSFLTVYPDGAARPTASNLNWVAGQAATPNQVTVPLGGNGRIDFFNAHGKVDVIADVEGYFAGGTVQTTTTVTTRHSTPPPPPPTTTITQPPSTTTSDAPTSPSESPVGSNN